MNLGKAIRALRRARKITQKELASRCSVSTTAIRNIESEKSWPSVKTLEKISGALKYPMSFFLFFSIEDCDVPEEKKGIFRQLYPLVCDFLIKDV